MSTLIVLWCLHDEKVCTRAKRFVGFSMKTSKQSIITVTLRPSAYWKHMGMVFHRFLWGQLMKHDNLASITVIHELKILDTLDKEILKR